jgi:hypothetical protein
MLERIAGSSGIDAFGELLLLVVVGDGQVDAVVIRLPEERYFDPVGLAVVEFSKIARVHRVHPPVLTAALGAKLR